MLWLTRSCTAGRHHRGGKYENPVSVYHKANFGQSILSSSVAFARVCYRTVSITLRTTLRLWFNRILALRTAGLPAARKYMRDRIKNWKALADSTTFFRIYKQLSMGPDHLVLSRQGQANQVNHTTSQTTDLETWDESCDRRRPMGQKGAQNAP